MAKDFARKRGLKCHKNRWQRVPQGPPSFDVLAPVYQEHTADGFGADSGGDEGGRSRASGLAAMEDNGPRRLRRNRGTNRSSPNSAPRSPATESEPRAVTNTMTSHGWRQAWKFER